MAEPVNGGNGSQPPKEMSMEVRLLLAFVLMGVVMFVSQYYFKSQAPPPAPQKTAQTTPAPATPAAAAEPAKETAPAAAEDAKAEAAPNPDATPQQSLPPFVIDTDLYRVTFSNQGANVRSWLLKKYKGNDNKPLEMLNTASGLPFPFSLAFGSQKPAKDVNWAWYVQTPDPDGLGVSYEYSDGHTTIHKKFRFEKNSFLSNVATDVVIDGKPVDHRIEWRGGFGDLTVSNPAGTEKTLHFDVANNKLVEKTARDAKNGPLALAGNFSFAGIADTYFAAVFLPQGSSNLDVVTTADTVRTPLEEKPAHLPRRCNCPEEPKTASSSSSAPRTSTS